MKLNVLLKDIKDNFVRDAFFRVVEYLRAQKILDGGWKFFEVELEAGSAQPVRHGLSFTPRDVIVLAIDGDHNVFFNYQDFDSQYVYVTAAGPCRLRFLLGRFEEKSYGNSARDFTFVPPS